MVRCPWQIIKTKTAADSKKKILIHLVLFQQERDQNKLVKHQSKSNLESVQPNTGAIQSPHKLNENSTLQGKISLVCPYPPSKSSLLRSYTQNQQQRFLSTFEEKM